MVIFAIREKSKYLCRFSCAAAAVFLALGPIGTGSTSGSPVLDRDASRTINLTAFRGKTFLQAMQSSGDGIFDKTEIDDHTPVTIASADQIVSAICQFDSRVTNRLFSMFNTGQNGVSVVMGKIQGTSLSPQTIRSALTPYISAAGLNSGARPNIAVDMCADMALLASGSGTLVEIDGNNYFYNVGYQNPVVKSGRSFGVAPGRALLDPSDKDYLSEMGDYLKPATTPDSTDFYLNILRLLTSCNSSGFVNLTASAQVVATDFLTVYTAELDRHVMVNLVPATDPWEIDIGEVTFITAYGAASGMVMQNGALVPGTATNYYGSGVSGGGIGETRKDFVKLAKAITAFENDPQHHPELVSAVLNLIPIQDATIMSQVNGDLFRQFLVYLNRPEFQGDIQTHPDAFVNAMLKFLQQIKVDQAQITQYIQNTP